MLRLWFRKEAKSVVVHKMQQVANLWSLVYGGIKICSQVKYSMME